MANEQIRPEECDFDDRKNLKSSPRAGRRVLRWVPWAASLVTFLLVTLPFVNSNEPGHFDQWIEAPVNGPFGFTGSIAALPEPTPVAAVVLHSELGHFDGQNYYRHMVCDPFQGTFDPGGFVRAVVPSSGGCTLSGDLPGTAGWCCASKYGWGDDGVINYAATAPTYDLTHVQVETAPPFTVTPMGVDPPRNLVSVTYGPSIFGFYATGYDLTAGTLNTYLRSGGTWQLVDSVPCDSPFNNYHWDTAADPTGSKLWITCRNGGPVSVRQMDLNTGGVDWSVQIDTPPASSDFYYQGIEFCGEVPGAGPAVAVMSPSPQGTVIGMVAGVGNQVPPTAMQLTFFTDAAPDRQVFECFGSMIFYHGPDPDGSGILDRFLNCGDLSGPCIWLDARSNSRYMHFGGGPPDHVAVMAIPTATPPMATPTPTPPGVTPTATPPGVTPTATPPPPIPRDHTAVAEGPGSRPERAVTMMPIRYDKYPIFEGYNPPGTGSDVVRVGALTVPFFFDTFESGDLRFWSAVVGE